ncbi:sedoheptulose-1,7-bisphosphatase [Hirsutella rhossiliensis]|uniref:fructose-bisphosphatase n=1 Tax=Hirsutella rhossiliensis TaxID=111463 RepID=A0A9P8N4L7_9HYPO|nr:sedoheptulose-1,7-bisphosphatase [Hirsutella rhossiliensis]KAH0968333.1 sedoheptulose-1,7-bisphosphatase [Hirsutella rhossiliensis]
MQSQLEQLLPSLRRPALCNSVLPALLDSIWRIAQTLRQSHQVTLAGTANAFGDDQLNVDVSAEELVRQALASCPSVVAASSEEEPIERPAGSKGDQPERYTVAFDPLDGSSIIASNWTVGTIVGIWDGASSLRQPPADKQVAAVLGVYGPRTTAFVALRVPGAEPACVEMALGEQGKWQILRPHVRFADPSSTARYFAPANLRAAAESPPYMRLVRHYVDEKYTLRYSGGLVPDVVHALVKGHGIYLSPVTFASGAKLRRLYELCPIALVVECAGGKAVDPASGEEILSQPLESCDDRAGLICGTADEVDFATREMCRPHVAETGAEGPPERRSTEGP